MPDNLSWRRAYVRSKSLTLQGFLLRIFFGFEEIVGALEPPMGFRLRCGGAYLGRVVCHMSLTSGFFLYSYTGYMRMESQATLPEGKVKVTLNGAATIGETVKQMCL